MHLLNLLNLFHWCHGLLAQPDSMIILNTVLTLFTSRSSFSPLDGGAIPNILKTVLLQLLLH